MQYQSSTSNAGSLAVSRTCNVLSSTQHTITAPRLVFTLVAIFPTQLLYISVNNMSVTIFAGNIYNISVFLISTQSSPRSIQYINLQQQIHCILQSSNSIQHSILQSPTQVQYSGISFNVYISHNTTVGAIISNRSFTRNS